MRKKITLLLSVLAILLILVAGSGKIGKIGNIGGIGGTPPLAGQIKIVSEESVTIDIVKRVAPAVVTVGITKNQPIIDWGLGPLSKQIKQDIGSGFVVKADGLIVTNKHVVADTGAKYRIITSDNKSFDVVKIYRDSNNDLAILKITASDLPTVELGDSSKLQVGQFAVAIGTALGEFRSTVTTGVVSGLGRGITAAGAPFEGSEKLENVIQTSAAINPGNSGGPLLNSSGQVIGVNVAVASDAQNIGFALPINLIKESLRNFETNGGFVARAYLGVEYRMVTRDLAVLNEIPEGAYVASVVADSPAEKAGVLKGDIITKIDGQNIREADGGLAKIISSKRPGQTVELTVYRGTETKTFKTTLTESTQ